MRIYHVAFAVLLAASCDQGKSKLDDLEGQAARGRDGRFCRAGSEYCRGHHQQGHHRSHEPGRRGRRRVSLIAWKELDATYHGQIDKRAATRTKADAASSRSRRSTSSRPIRCRMTRS